MFNLKEILSVTLILFSIIDILGSVPLVIELRKKAGHIQSLNATIVSGVIMIAFLFLGQSILQLFNLDVQSFAIAGAIIIFIIAMEMVLGIDLFRQRPGEEANGSIVPLAFPIIAGAGSLTTILSLRAIYQVPNIFVGIVVNLIFVYIVLKASTWLEKKLGASGFSILRKVFGIILLSIAVKIFKENLIYDLKAAL